MTLLAAHGWELEVLPETGGAINRLRHAGRDILRAGPPANTDPLQAASFPMIPYVNRIAHCRMRFTGREWRLPANFGDHPHCLHGIGWQRPWEVQAVTADSLELHLRHPGGNGWPFAFQAQQRMMLAQGCFAMSLSLTNLSGEPAPAGLGFHPYFPRHPDSRLTARFAAAWRVSADGLPLERVAPDSFGNWAAGESPEQPMLIDNPYEGWDGEAMISGGGIALRMTGRNTRHFQIYAPPGADFFCAEPATDLPDAVNRSEMQVLRPGESMEIGMRLELI